MANLPGKLKYMIPDDDRSVFVEPQLPLCQNIINANRRRIEQYNFTICGLDYTNLRNQIRTEVINKAKKYT
ncbi:MAG: hypothetical protein ACUZ8H_13435, partial [Candidatus Anammoxibacter sp.]